MPLLPTFDLPTTKRRLVLPVGWHRVTGSPGFRCPQALPRRPGCTRDNRWRRAIWLQSGGSGLQAHHAGGGKILSQALDISDPRAAPAIEWTGRHPRRTGCVTCQHPQPGVLDGVVSWNSSTSIWRKPLLVVPQHRGCAATTVARSNSPRNPPYHRVHKPFHRRDTLQAWDMGRTRRPGAASYVGRRSRPSAR